MHKVWTKIKGFSYFKFWFFSLGDGQIYKNGNGSGEHKLTTEYGHNDGNGHGCGIYFSYGDIGGDGNYMDDGVNVHTGFTQWI